MIVEAVQHKSVWCSRSGDPATYSPLNLPISSTLTLQMRFSDGSVRDFSTDSRAVFTVTSVSVRTALGKQGGRLTPEGQKNTQNNLSYYTVSSVYQLASAQVRASVAFTIQQHGLYVHMLTVKQAHAWRMLGNTCTGSCTCKLRLYDLPKVMSQPALSSCRTLRTPAKS